jgi:hypothetical protein
MRPLSEMTSFVLSRWRGEVPLERIFWRDMIAIGTTLNLLTGLTAIVLLASGAPAAIALMVHFSPLPWNVFLFLVVWRRTEIAEPSNALIVKAVAVIWLVAVTVL